MDSWTLLWWVGKLLFVAFFVMSGLNHLMNVKGLAGYAQSKHVPAPALAVVGTGLLLLAGSAMILVNWHAGLGAWLLVLFLVPTAFMMHNYWAETDPMARANQSAHFWKNITLAAAAMLYALAQRGM